MGFRQYKASLPDSIRNAEEILHEYAYRTSNIDSLSERLSPFHELYADIVTATFFEDPDILVNSSEQIEKCRSFSSQFSLSEDSNPSQYCKLAEVRFDLWNKWIKFRLNDKKEILSTLGNVIANAAVAGEEADFAKYVKRHLNF